MKWLRFAFYALLVRPVLILLLGFNVRNFERLKILDTAQLIAANHNSHLDALVLMSLIPLSEIHKVKLVAAKDYFCRTPFLTWFSLNIIGVIPIDRKGEADDPLAPVMRALDEGYSVVIFPEGSRGEAEKRQPLKYGIAKILEAKPEIPMTPIFMHGLGKSLPRGEALFVPFVCDINIGEPLLWTGDRTALVETVGAQFDALEVELGAKEWR